MKRGWVCLLTSLLAACSVSSKYDLLINHPAPQTRIALLDGQHVTLKDFKGAPAVIVFWDVECPHCNQLMPKLESAAKELSKKGVRFLAISINNAQHREEVKNQIEYLELNHFVHAFSGNGIYDESYLAFGGQQVPLIVVLDKNGIITKIDDDISALSALLDRGLSSPRLLNY